MRLPLTGRRAVALAGTVVLLVAGGTAASAALSDPPAYRLATVSVGSTGAALIEPGTVRPVNQTAIAFPIAGQVASVQVRPGQSVTAGQLLATLDTSALSAQLASAEAGVAKAVAKLSADQASQTAATGSGSTGTSPDLAARQRTLLADKHAADVALAQTRTALNRAKAACAPATPTSSKPGAPNSVSSTSAPSSSSPSSSAPPKSPADGGAEPSPSASSRPPAGDQDACASAQGDALGWEVTSFQAEQAVATDAAALTALLAAAGGTGSPAAHTPAHPASADQLAADQAAVDAASAAELSVRQSLNQARLLSPMGGTVRAVTLTAGQSVQAQSATQNVVISGSGGQEAVVEVGVDDMDSVSQSARAQVVPDGSSTSLDGTVTAIALLPSTGTSPTYTVTVALRGGTNLPDGASATVTILPPGGTDTAVVVPSSAVTTSGGQHTVRVYSGGRVSTVVVGVGTSGPVYTQITHGLSAGQRVVLADLAAPLPASTGGARSLKGRSDGGNAAGNPGG